MYYCGGIRASQGVGAEVHEWKSYFRPTGSGSDWDGLDCVLTKEDYWAAETLSDFRAGSSIAKV